MDTLWQLTAVLVILTASGCYGGSIVSYHIYYEKSDAVFTAVLDQYTEATWTLPNDTRLGPYSASQHGAGLPDTDIKTGNGKVGYVPKLRWLSGFYLQANLTIVNYRNGGTGEYYFKASTLGGFHSFSFVIEDPGRWTVSDILNVAVPLVVVCIICTVLAVFLYKFYRKRQMFASSRLVIDGTNSDGVTNDA